MPGSAGRETQQRRLSGICSLGGAAVKLDMQFPSEDVSAEPEKGSMGGWRPGQAISDPCLVSALQKMPQPFTSARAFSSGSQKDVHQTQTAPGLKYMAAWVTKSPAGLSKPCANRSRLALVVSGSPQP
jgi:hypothetical protein